MTTSWVGHWPGPSVSVMDRRERNERKARILCELGFSKLAEDADGVLRRRVLDLLTLWEERKTCDPSYPRRWRMLLALPTTRARSIVLADDHEAIDLQTSNPFAALLTAKERRKLLAEVGL